MLRVLNGWRGSAWGRVGVGWYLIINLIRESRPLSGGVFGFR